MPAPIPVYVSRLPPTLAECGQPVRDELASTWIDVFSEQLHRRFAHSSAMLPHLTGAAQKRCGPALQAVGYFAGLLAGATKPTHDKECPHDWAFTVDRCRDLGDALGKLEARIWTELKRLAKTEDAAEQHEVEQELTA